MIRIRMRTHDDLQAETHEVTRATRQKYEQISRDNQVTRNHRYLHIFSPETETCRPSGLRELQSDYSNIYGL